MTTAAPGAGTVSRYWKTGLIITQTDLTGLITSDPADAEGGEGRRCQVISADSAGIGLAAIREQFLASMNALADADDAPQVRDCEVTVQVWRGGYDQPAFSSQSRYIGWTVLAVSAATEHSESGCLAFADPRAGSAGTARACKTTSRCAPRPPSSCPRPDLPQLRPRPMKPAGDAAFRAPG